MLLKQKTVLLRGTTFVLLVAASAHSASAGPLVDWLLNKRWKDSQPVAYVPSTTVPTSVNYAPLTYAPTQAVLGAAQTTATGTAYNTAPPVYNVPSGLGYAIPQTSAALLPTHSYGTFLNKVPTTYYRPVTSLDPNTGTTVTSLQPCTSYQMQTLRMPLLSPSTYYAAYGNYGAGLQQDRFSPITGSGVAASAGQSSLSIPSSATNTSLSPVMQLPANGYTVTPTTYLPPSTILQPVPSASTLNVAPSATQVYSNAVPTYPTTTYPANSYPTSTANYQSYGNVYSTPPAINYSSSGQSSSSYVQADGSIVTPLGPPTMSAAPSVPSATTSYSNMSALSPAATTNQATMVPNTTAAPSYSSSYPATDSTISELERQYGAGNVTRLPEGTAYNQPSNSAYPYSSTSSSYSQSVYPSTGSNGASSANTSDVLPQTQVLPNNNLIPAPPIGNTHSNPALNDTESQQQPTLSPLSINGSNNVNFATAMSPIESPNAVQFTRRTLDQAPAYSAAPPQSAYEPAAVPSPTLAAQEPALPSTGDLIPSPSLLGPVEGFKPTGGILAPEGYDPQPFWRAEQKTTTPDALRNDAELTAAVHANPALQGRLRQIDQTPTRSAGQMQSASHIEFINRSKPADAVENKNAPVARLKAPGQRLQIDDDGFRPASR